MSVDSDLDPILEAFRRRLDALEITSGAHRAQIAANQNQIDNRLAVLTRTIEELSRKLSDLGARR